MARTLLAVLSNPPTTPGERTLGRIRLARDILGFDDVAVANLFPLPSRTTRDIAELGQMAAPWIAARTAVEEQLCAAGGVLLAYGLERPRGVAGVWHREQLTWLDAALGARALPLFWVGGAPRHPSRWQRCTSRRQPTIPFRDALALELTPVAGSRGPSAKDSSTPVPGPCHASGVGTRLPTAQ